MPTTPRSLVARTHCRLPCPLGEAWHVPEDPVDVGLFEAGEVAALDE